MHCLTSATPGPAHVPLKSADGLFRMDGSAGHSQIFRQAAFIHADLPFALISLSILRAQGCFFAFYDVIWLQCGPLVFRFPLIDGLSLAEIFSVPVDSSPISTFDLCSVSAVLVAQTCSITSALFNIDSESTPVVVKQPVVGTAAGSASTSADIVAGTAPLPESMAPPSFSSPLTGAGLLLLLAHWNADKELSLERHRELHGHDDRPPPSVQVLDTKWVLD